MNILQKIKIKIKYFELTSVHKNILRFILYPLITSQVILTTVNITELRVKNQVIEIQNNKVFETVQKLDTELKKLDKFANIENNITENKNFDLSSNIHILTNQIKQDISNEMKRNEKREKERVINSINYFYNELIHYKSAVASQMSGTIMLKILNNQHLDEITKRKFRLLYNKYDTSGYGFQYELIKTKCNWYDLSCTMTNKYMIKNLNNEAIQIKKNDKIINSFKFKKSADPSNSQVETIPKSFNTAASSPTLQKK